MFSPAHNDIKVQFSIPNTSGVSIKILNQQGIQVFLERGKTLQAGQYTYTVPITKLVAGTYYAQLFVDGKPGITVPFVKL